MRRGFLLIPQRVSATTATIWIGAINETVRVAKVELEFSDGVKSDSVELDGSEWQTWRSFRPLDWKLPPDDVPRHSLHFQRVTLGLQQELKTRAKYDLSLRVNGELVDCGARMTTLPSALPPPGDKPFTILLGSCYYQPNDKEHGLVGKTFYHIPPDERPEIKVLCGDQVYLDNPYKDSTTSLRRPFGDPTSMRNIFFDKYCTNWFDKVGEDGGFNRLLTDGANYFCSDDHEFWNNAPDIGIVGILNTLLTPQREWWFNEATELFRAFQSPTPMMTLAVDPVAVCIADTRINRHPGRDRFMEDEDLDALGQWIKDLKGPGVLVLGQLVLSPYVDPARFWDIPALSKKYIASGFSWEVLVDHVSTRFDKGLPDYRQYEKLIGYLKSSKHSIVVLTGDVHFGRIAQCHLDKELGTRLIEIVSSPMQVVSNVKGEATVGIAVDAPVDHFEKLGDDIKFAEERNHFVTIEFSKGAGAAVNMKVKFWPILDADARPPAVCKTVFETSLL